MKISEVSKKFNISIQTLRYYENEKILPPIPRDKSGHRNYQETDLYWVHYVKALRLAGVDIESIKKYVILVKEGSSTRDERKQILLEQRRQIIKKIAIDKDALKHMDIKLGVYDKYMIDIEKNTGSV